MVSGVGFRGKPDISIVSGIGGLRGSYMVQLEATGQAMSKSPFAVCRQRVLWNPKTFFAL